MTPALNRPLKRVNSTVYPSLLLLEVALAVAPPNSAPVSDACAAALRAFYSAPQRGR